MIPPLSILIIAFAADIVRAHFSLKYPPPLGDLKEQGEGTGPCGGYAFDLKYAAETTDFHVGGDSILVTTGHPQNKWLYRISVATNNGSDVNPSNWTQVYPIVLQGGLNSYCQPAVTIPDGFVGQKAILSVVGKAQDGLLYQCAAVTFVSGTGTPPEACANTTGVDVSFSYDFELAALVGTNVNSNSSGTGPPSETPLGVPDAAPTTHSSVQRLGSLVAAGMMVLAV